MHWFASDWPLSRREKTDRLISIFAAEREALPEPEAEFFEEAAEAGPREGDVPATRLSSAEFVVQVRNTFVHVEEEPWVLPKARAATAPPSVDLALDDAERDIEIFLAGLTPEAGSGPLELAEAGWSASGPPPILVAAQAETGWTVGACAGTCPPLLSPPSSALFAGTDTESPAMGYNLDLVSLDSGDLDRAEFEVRGGDGEEHADVDGARGAVGSFVAAYVLEGAAGSAGAAAAGASAAIGDDAGNAAGAIGVPDAGAGSTNAAGAAAAVSDGSTAGGPPRRRRWGRSSRATPSCAEHRDDGMPFEAARRKGKGFGAPLALGDFPNAPQEAQGAVACPKATCAECRLGDLEVATSAGAGCTAGAEVGRVFSTGGCTGMQAEAEDHASCASGYAGTALKTCASAGQAFSFNDCSREGTCALLPSPSRLVTTAHAPRQDPLFLVRPSSPPAGADARFDSDDKLAAAAETEIDGSECTGIKTEAVRHVPSVSGDAGTASCASTGQAYSLSGCSRGKAYTEPPPSETSSTGRDVAASCAPTALRLLESSGGTVSDAAGRCTGAKAEAEGHASCASGYAGAASRLGASAGQVYSFSDCPQERTCAAPPSPNRLVTTSCAPQRDPQCLGWPSSPPADADARSDFDSKQAAAVETEIGTSGCTETKTEAMRHVPSASGHAGTASWASTGKAYSSSGCSRGKAHIPLSPFATSSSDMDVATSCAPTATSRVRLSAAASAQKRCERWLGDLERIVDDAYEVLEADDDDHHSLMNLVEKLETAQRKTGGALFALGAEFEHTRGEAQRSNLLLKEGLEAAWNELDSLQDMCKMQLYCLDMSTRHARERTGVG